MLSTVGMVALEWNSLSLTPLRLARRHICVCPQHACEPQQGSAVVFWAEDTEMVCMYSVCVCVVMIIPEEMNRVL